MGADRSHQRLERYTQSNVDTRWHNKLKDNIELERGGACAYDVTPTRARRGLAACELRRRTTAN